MRPLAIDLFCGLGGWTDGLLAEGYEVIGFDTERHVYGEHRYPAQLVIQDVLTLHGSQFRDADLIVASPPCQEYSYMAMPWSRAKAKAAAIRADETGAELERLNRLFNACFRIQREACEAAGRHIPMVVENVRGAQPWVGRARYNFGSFYLWGDVPALMPIAMRGAMKQGVAHRPNGETNFHRHAEGVKVATMGAGWYPPDHPKHVPGLAFNGRAERAIKNNGGSWFAVGGPGQKVVGQNPDGRLVHRRDGHAHTRPLTNAGEHGVKNGSDWFGAGENCSAQRRSASKSPGRKMASAMIAKIPLPLSRWVAKASLPPVSRSEAA